MSRSHNLKYQNSKAIWNEHVYEITWMGPKFEMFCAGTPAWDGNPVLCDVIGLFLSDMFKDSV